MILAEFIHKLQQYPQGMDIHLGDSLDYNSIYGNIGDTDFKLVTSRESFQEGLKWADTKTLKMPVPHTPGHWSFAKDTQYTFEKYCVNHNNKQHQEAGLSTVVAEVSEGPHGLANARLIACAPDLLATLIDLANYVEELQGERHCSKAWMIAKAIIKNATGE
jgi:hypothetical protein